MNWILATKAQGEGYLEFHMVLLQITSFRNKAMACVVASGATNMKPDQNLDSTNVMRAWASRTPKKLSECDTCPGYGIKRLISSSNAMVYEETESLYQVSEYISQSCPGDENGYSNSLKNVTVELIDSYAGLAFLGGENVHGGDAQEAVVFFNRNLYPVNVSISNVSAANDDLFVDNIDLYEDSPDNVTYINGSDVNEGMPIIKSNASIPTGNAVDGSGNVIEPIGISYVVGYVDHAEDAFKMVEVQVSVDNGLVHVCSPTAKTYNSAPEQVNNTNIAYFWENADLMNVASCRQCAGYGVTMFKFSTFEGVAATPPPSTAPVAVPTAIPTTEPTALPTFAPTNIDLERGNYWAEDAADGVIDGEREVVWVPVASPTKEPIVEPTFAPIPGPTFYPVTEPTVEPTMVPSSPSPTEVPLEVNSSFFHCSLSLFVC